MIYSRVSGTTDYRVRLWVEGSAVDGECSCPMGDDGVFCKHCVAVGLAYLDGEAQTLKHPATSRKKTRGGRRKKQVTADDIRAYLAGQEKECLVDLIMKRLPWDDGLRQALMLRTARHGTDGLNVAAYRKAITDATRAGGGFVDYRDAPAFARGIEMTVDSIQELLDEGHASEVIGLTEHALARCEQALGAMDDSDGCMGEILGRLQDIHHSACVGAKPEPEELARRLFCWEVETGWDTFYGAAETYSDVLGPEGLTVYDQLARAMWDELPALGPGDKGSFDGNRFRLTSIMESLAKASGDIDERVAVMSKDLSSAYKFLQIAEVYGQARQHRKALAWAERGLEAFRENPDDRLENFVADQYHRTKRHDDAMAIIWGQFERGPSLAAYAHLQAHADRARDWPTWRTKALELIHRRIGEAVRRPGRDAPWTRPRLTDHSLLVAIYLWEEDLHSAWEEAKTGGCSEDLWMQLAALREKDHPADAVAVYRRQIDPIVDRRNNEAYRQASSLIRKIKRLMNGLGQEAEFAGFLATVRAAHKRKRNFMKLLDRVR
ncbi:MAG: SWIM zinc finger family protein [Planctomycetota bacterium]